MTLALAAGGVSFTAVKVGGGAPVAPSGPKGATEARGARGNGGIGDEMETVEGVAAVLRLGFQFMMADGDDTFVSAIDRSAVEPLELVAVRGMLEMGERTVLIQESYADDAVLAVGDSVEAQVPVGKRT